MACRPAGWSTVQWLSLVSGPRRCSAAFSSLSGVCRDRPPAYLTFPEINGGRLGLPDARLLDAGQAGQHAIFRAERDILVRLGHDRRLAGDAVAQYAEAVLGADHESIEAVKVVEAHFEGVAERQALAHAPSEITGRHLGVVLGLESESFTLQHPAEIVVIGERAVMHQALVRASRV